MRYQIQRLDGRYSYRRWFQYYIKFRSSMNYDQGPLHFTTVQRWFTETYGWSAEIRQWADIYRWIGMSLQTNARPWYTDEEVLENLPDVCNPAWSWTNGTNNDLRIYIAGDQELSLFKLKF